MLLLLCLVPTYIIAISLSTCVTGTYQSGLGSKGGVDPSGVIFEFSKSGAIDRSSRWVACSTRPVVAYIHRMAGSTFEMVHVHLRFSVCVLVGDEASSSPEEL